MKCRKKTPCRCAIHLLVCHIFSFGYTERERIEGPYVVIVLTHQFIVHRYCPGSDQRSIAWGLAENIYIFFFHGATAPNKSWRLHCRDFTITIRHTTLRKTPLYEWSAQSRDLYLTKHNTHKRRHPCFRKNLNPNFHQRSGRRPTP